MILSDKIQKIDDFKVLSLISFPFWFEIVNPASATSIQKSLELWEAFVYV